MNRTTLLLTLCLAAAGGCSKKKSEPAESSAGENAPQPAKRNPPNVRKVVTPISIEEVGALLPTPPGARVIKEPTKATYGERIEASFCFDEGEVAALSETVKTTLTDAGWGGLVMRENPTVKDRTNLTAQHPPFMMTGSIQRSAVVAECSQDKGQTLVSLNVHKQIPRPAGLPVGRQPGLMRPNVGRPMPQGLAPGAPGGPVAPGGAAPGGAPAPVNPSPAPATQ